MERRGEGSSFRLDDDYREALGNRPVLGQAFEDVLFDEIRSAQGVPPWFSNLLPEGRLRELVAERADVHPTREFFLLAELGLDLPGAVIIRPVRELESQGERADERAEVPAPDEPLRFSLAGVQLKFSAIREGRGLTVPVEGRGGDWIVKLPDSRFAD